MQKHIFLAPMLAALAVCGCQGDRFNPPEQTRDPLLRGLKPPPVNMPARGSNPAPAPPAADQTPAPPQEPGVLVMLDGRPARGAIKAVGRIVMTSGLIAFIAENKSNVRVAYRLPASLTAPPDLQALGSLDFFDRTSPGGPDRQVIVATEGVPLLGEVRRTSRAPITADLGSGLALRQRAVAAEGIREVPVEFVQQQGAQPLSTRKVSDVKVSTGVLRIWIDASHRVDIPDPAGQYPGQYILHAWIVRSGG